MKHILTIIKKELNSYFNSPAAYVIIVVFLVFVSWMYGRSMFLMSQATMRSFFSLIPWVFLIMIPAITMKMWAEERKLGTTEILLTLPVKDWEVVIGKFCASLLFVIITLLGTLIIPIILISIGNPDVGAIIGSYLGTILLAGSYLSIGLWVSGLTDNQVIAFIVSVSIIFIFLMLGATDFLYFVPDTLRGFFRGISLSHHYSSVTRGVIDTRDILYYVSLIGFFLYLNLKNIQSRNWN